MTTQSSTDQIRKEITLRAPIARVWRAISKSQEFAAWFRLEIDGEFEEGKTVAAVSTHSDCAGARFDMEVTCMREEAEFAFRGLVTVPDENSDSSKPASTLVQFLLEADGEQTKLVVIESGFDSLPADQRKAFYEGNDAGWTHQMENIRVYCEDA